MFTFNKTSWAHMHLLISTCDFWEHFYLGSTVGACAGLLYLRGGPVHWPSHGFWFRVSPAPLVAIAYQRLGLWAQKRAPLE